MKANSKSAQRALFAKLRSNISPFERAALSAVICGHIARSDIFLSAKTVMLYYPIGSEADLRQLLFVPQGRGKSFLLPVTLPGGIMRAAVYEPGFSLSRTKFGTYEPENPDLEETCEIGLVLVPGIAFDFDGGRIGYGKGYYDRFLPGLGGTAHVAGVCFNAQISPKPLDVREHDYRIKTLVTERGIHTVSE